MTVYLSLTQTKHYGIMSVKTNVCIHYNYQIILWQLYQLIVLMVFSDSYLRLSVQWAIEPFGLCNLPRQRDGGRARYSASDYGWILPSQVFNIVPSINSWAQDLLLTPVDLLLRSSTRFISFWADGWRISLKTAYEFSWSHKWVVRW